MAVVTRKKQEYRLYKPYYNKEKKTYSGAATSIQQRVVLDPSQKEGKNRKVLIFWVTSQQTGVDKNQNSTFAWGDPTKTVTMKLEHTDIASILAMLKGKIKKIGTNGSLYHQTPKGSTTLTLETVDGREGFRLTVSYKGKTDKNALRISHSITPVEALEIELVLEDAFRELYDFIN